MLIVGEHYFLDEKLSQQAQEMFGINGIPHYAIINRDGIIISKKAKRPGEVQDELLGHLQK